MMSRHKDAGTLVSEIIMTRRAHKGAFLLLEGEDDSRFWRPRVVATGCEIIIANGKRNLVGALLKLDRRDGSPTDTVGLVDDDCDRLRNVEYGSPNLVYTDARDLEGVLLQSSAFHKVVAEFGDPAKVRAFEALGTPLREALLQRALPLGRMRWLAMNHGACCDELEIRLPRFLNVDTWRFDEDLMLDIAGRCGALPSRPSLDDAYAQHCCSDPWRVCRGHDLLQILAAGFKKVLGNENPGEKAIAKVLRSGIETPELTALQLYRDLQSWESRNPPLRVVQ